ncbi:MAG: redoxin family protein [Phycisphaerales bacterium]|nr:redoxin family protein [Phycisphaerales bacterium]
MVALRSLLIVLAAALSIASPPAIAQDAETLAPGSMAPPLVIDQWPRGVPVTRFERGRVYVVEFWATWCTPCHLVVPKLTELQRNNPALTVISVAASEQATTVNRDDRLEKVQDYVTKRSDEIGFTIAYDGSGEMWRRWMVPAQRGGIPAAFIVGPDGRLTWIGNPLVPDFEKELAATLARPDVNKTPAPARWTPMTPSPRSSPVLRPAPAPVQQPTATVPARASSAPLPKASTEAQTKRFNTAPREFKIEFVPETAAEPRPSGLTAVREATERATPNAVTTAAAPSTPKASAKPTSKTVAKPSAKPINKPINKLAAKPSPKPTPKPTSKPTKPAAKPAAAPR